MRIPLHIKLMVSYVVIITLVVAPSLAYLQHSLRDHAREAVRVELEREAEAIRTHIATLPAEVRVDRANAIASALPDRLTLVDVDGNVLADSVGRPLPNHSDRPEIREALASGSGFSIRTSATTRQSLVYVAKRFPVEGPALGVVRVARPLALVEAASDRTVQVARRAGALALSVAVLFSLLAALWGSRPLRRLARGVQAFAAGDFGHPIDVTSNDEIGDTAQALVELSRVLRDRFVAAGADHATLRALLDQLPVGVLLYDASRRPTVVNAAARALCHLEPENEGERAAQLASLPGQRERIERLLDQGTPVDTRCEIPWADGTTLDGQWVLVYDTRGHPAPALVVAAKTTAEAPTRSSGRALAVVSLASLWQRIESGIKSNLDDQLALSLAPGAPPDIAVVDEDSLALDACVALVTSSARSARGSKDISIRFDVHPHRVDLHVANGGAAAVDPQLQARLRSIGGEIHTKEPSWIAFPRA